ncbi:hypothetical protein [Acidithiobacillus caldus]|jgi:hypothetical protein|uniref:Uncharacterized protein n=2 Tax=Acidithiobacillus caldus TaxID=33059 RepID=A0A1E7YPC7_9PROT|nr:hypothetical protein [Acidithiobacillus caldus]AIA55560.1 hypothetical protein Acaty_c1700 [Acidithiobacillus caldus ATCC 51756]MBU2729294.1 hypothetical protein [Acidithiobacillus caldus]MBU2736519.1 hypothetical protein [Acidithiobacillus caldus ATCC 51756]MBU2744825.1 hypothetical protein [Acidithiobacillus caldus]MBU2762326.1 hypothetical protein [Acidithiobacillus caldus]
MRGFLILWFPFLLSTAGLLFSPIAEGADGNRTISVPMLGSTLTVQTRNRFAGAISSITWNGQSFIDSRDHGRELQSDVVFDHYGVCYNPTEAGSQANGAGDRSSSVLRAIRVRGNQLWSVTQLAFWLQPGQSSYPNVCGRLTDLHRAVNRAALSRVILHKHLTVGLPGFPNVLRESLTFDVPAPYQSATFEVLTGYMPPAFSEVFAFHPRSLRWIAVQGRRSEQPYPVIRSTADHRYAMGIYTPGLPQVGWPHAGYGSRDFPGVVKWNCVYRYRSVAARPYHFLAFSVI